MEKKTRWVVEGLLKNWLRIKVRSEMEAKFDPEKVAEFGKQFGRAILESLTPEDFLELMKPEDVLKALKPEDRLKGLGPEELKAVKSYIEKIEKSSGVD